jgi:DNA-binding transcriptional LysR family regulator
MATVETGGWMTVLPEDAARFHASGKAVELIPLAGPEPAHSVGLVAPWREPHTPVLESLLREARRLGAETQ